MLHFTIFHNVSIYIREMATKASNALWDWWRKWHWVVKSVAHCQPHSTRSSIDEPRKKSFQEHSVGIVIQWQQNFLQIFNFPTVCWYWTIIFWSYFCFFYSDETIVLQMILKSLHNQEIVLPMKKKNKESCINLK